MRRFRLMLLVVVSIAIFGGVAFSGGFAIGKMTGGKATSSTASTRPAPGAGAGGNAVFVSSPDSPGGPPAGGGPVVISAPSGGPPPAP